MSKTRANFLSTSAGQMVGKSQVYALLVDTNGEAILDADGNEQIVDLQAVNGRLKVDASISERLTYAETIFNDAAILSGASSERVKIDNSIGYSKLNWKITVAGLSDTVRIAIYGPDMTTNPLAPDLDNLLYISDVHSNTWSRFDGGILDISGIPALWIQLQEASADLNATLDVFMSI